MFDKDKSLHQSNSLELPPSAVALLSHRWRLSLQAHEGILSRAVVPMKAKPAVTSVLALEQSPSLAHGHRRHYSISMRRALKIHPNSRCTAATHIEVDVARPHPSHLALHYFVTGKSSDLRMSPVTTPTRADGLWRHTCFEAFVRASPSAAYYEFNFAPSMQWAAYRFRGYRSGMSVAGGVCAPHFSAQSDGKCCELQVSLELDGFPDLPDDAPWYLSLSAVIEETSGRMSYWALAHPPGEADFHHSDCFALELPAA